VACLLDAPNTTKLSAAELATRLSSIFPLVVKANSTHAKDVHLKTFTSLTSLFDPVPADLEITDAQAKTALEKILFDPSFEGLPEAMRVKRAEALVAVGKLKGCGWVAEKVKPEVEGGERSALVRGVLAKVGKE
jgi:proteasome component ECM29